MTLSNYSISWDSPIHFRRGQAYLEYILTGNREYGAHAEYNLEKHQTEPDYHERSFYKSDQYNANFWLEIGGGHPPLNGILASVSNRIFFEKLGWLGDIEAYNFFIIFVSSILVAGVFYWGYITYSFWMALASAIFTSLYPLFWAESHFNIKDSVETSFFFLALLFLWKGVVDKKNKLIILSSLFSGIALATKFNILFLPFIFVPWFILYKKETCKNLKNLCLEKKEILVFLSYPIVMVTILYISWPYLWQDFGNIFKVTEFYTQLGTQGTYQSGYEVFGFNLYPLYWFFITTPPVFLIFVVLGVVFIAKHKKRNDYVFYLWLALFLFPFLRVSLPSTVIYGGTRQIMEFLPGMALVAGLGFEFLRSKISKKTDNSGLAFGLIIIIIVSGLIPIINLHPYENTYINFLAGGLRGAYEKEIPAAGNTFGTVYKEGVEWINENAEDGAKLTLIQGTTSNLPFFQLREGVDYSNYHLSGINRQGEYIMDMTYNYELLSYNYAWEYVNRFLEPVHEVKRDGAVLLKIWKNDLRHTKSEYKYEEVYLEDVSTAGEESALFINLPEEEVVTRFVLSFSSDSCIMPVNAHVFTQNSAGEWKTEKDPTPFEQVGRVSNVKDGKLTYYIAGKKIQKIKLEVKSNSCLFNVSDIKVFVLNK